MQKAHSVRDCRLHYSCYWHRTLCTLWVDNRDLFSWQYWGGGGCQDSSAGRAQYPLVKGHGLDSWQDWQENFSSPELTFCANAFIVESTPMLLQWHVKDWSFYQNCWWWVTTKHAYTLDPTKSERPDHAVHAHYENLPGKQAHMQLVRECSSTVVSADWAMMDWSLAKWVELEHAIWLPL